MKSNSQVRREFLLASKEAAGLPVCVLVAVGGFFSLEPLRALEEDLHFAVRCPALGLEVRLVRAGQADLHGTISRGAEL